MHSSTFGRGWVGMSACPLVVLACESLHVCTVCIWRCEHARFCVEVFYALYINFHSFIYVSCFFIDTDKIITDKDYSYVTLIAFTEREGERISDHCVYCLSADLVTVNHSRSRPRTHATEQRKHLK